MCIRDRSILILKLFLYHPACRIILALIKYMFILSYVIILLILLSINLNLCHQLLTGLSHQQTVSHHSSTYMNPFTLSLSCFSTLCFNTSTLFTCGEIVRSTLITLLKGKRNVKTCILTDSVVF